MLPSTPLQAPDDRTALLSAARALLARGSRAAALTPEVLARSAGLTPEGFRAIYPEPAAFQADLLRLLLDEARDAATTAVASHSADALGLKRGLEAYLDCHLRQPALRELLALLRDQPEAQDMVQRRVAGFYRVLQVGFSALHATYPLASAQLVTALVVETSQAEYDAHAPLPALRETLYAYVDRLLR